MQKPSFEYTKGNNRGYDEHQYHYDQKRYAVSSIPDEIRIRNQRLFNRILNIISRNSPIEEIREEEERKEAQEFSPGTRVGGKKEIGDVRGRK